MEPEGGEANYKECDMTYNICALLLFAKLTISNAVAWSSTLKSSNATCNPSRPSMMSSGGESNVLRFDENSSQRANRPPAFLNIEICLRKFCICKKKGY